jgi:hypothetical protein
MSDERFLAVLVRHDSPFADDLAALTSEPAIKTKGFDGIDLLTILVPLATAIIPAVVKIVTKSIDAKRYIVVKHKGVEIRGISESKLTTILEQLAKPAAPRRETKPK